MAKEFSTIQAAVDAIRRGEVIIVLDAEDRENEGDFICAAELVTTETINFMLSGRGQLCCPSCRRCANDCSCGRWWTATMLRCERRS